MALGNNRRIDPYNWNLDIQAVNGYLFLVDGVCARVLPAADFDALPVLPSLRTLDAALAALGEVCFRGAFVCDKALPDDVLVVLPVDLLLNVAEALLATPFPVTFFLPIFFSLNMRFPHHKNNVH